MTQDLGMEKEEEGLIEDFETTVGLATGESYILFNNLRGKIVVWINCDKEMSVLMSLEDLKKSASSIFPDINLSSLLFYLNRGDYVYTDKKIIRPLRPQEIQMQNPTPTLNDVVNLQRKSKNVYSNFNSPFLGF